MLPALLYLEILWCSKSSINFCYDILGCLSVVRLFMCCAQIVVVSQPTLTFFDHTLIKILLNVVASYSTRAVFAWVWHPSDSRIARTAEGIVTYECPVAAHWCANVRARKKTCFFLNLTTSFLIRPWFHWIFENITAAMLPLRINTIFTTTFSLLNRPRSTVGLMQKISDISWGRPVHLKWA